MMIECEKGRWTLGVVLTDVGMGTLIELFPLPIIGLVHLTFRRLWPRLSCVADFVIGRWRFVIHPGCMEVGVVVQTGAVIFCLPFLNAAVKRGQ